MVEQYDYLERINACYHDDDLATVMAIRGTLKRSWASKAASPITSDAKNAAGANIIPMSVRARRRLFAAKANKPAATTVRAELLNNIAKAPAATKLAIALSNSLSECASSSGG